MTALARRRLTSITLPATLTPLAALLVMSGCDLVFGLGDPGALGDPDAPPGPHEVRVELVRRGVRNDPSGVPILESEPFRLPVEAITLADGTAPPVTSDPAGFLTFTRGSTDEGYRVELGDDAGGTEVQSSAAHLRFGVPEYGRLDRVEAATSPAIALQIGAAVPGNTHVVATTGVWTQTTIDPASGVLAWASAGAFTAPPGLLQASANDRAYAVRHDPRGDATTPFTALAAACELTPALEMTSGGSLSTGCTLADLPLDQCIHVDATLAAEDLRLQNALVAADQYTRSGSSWGILAAPAPGLSPRSGFGLAAGGASPARSWTLDVPHANPFPGHVVRLASASSRIRSVARPGAAPTTMVALTFETETPAADCSTPTRIGGTTAIPGGFVLDGSALVDDRRQMPSGAARVTLRWEHAASGEADYYVVLVDEVATIMDGGALTTTLVERRRYVTTTMSADIDSALFETDHAYAIGVLALRGVPGATDGDLDTHDPGSDGGALTWSGVFTIQP